MIYCSYGSIALKILCLLRLSSIVGALNGVGAIMMVGQTLSLSDENKVVGWVSREVGLVRKNNL
jgi:hypothetical protein